MEMDMTTSMLIIVIKKEVETDMHRYLDGEAWMRMIGRPRWRFGAVQNPNWFFATCPVEVVINNCKVKYRVFSPSVEIALDHLPCFFLSHYFDKTSNCAASPQDYSVPSKKK